MPILIPFLTGVALMLFFAVYILTSAEKNSTILFPVPVDTLKYFIDPGKSKGES